MSTNRSISCTVSRVLFPREEFSDGGRHFCVLLTSCGKVKGMFPFYPAHGFRLNLFGHDEVYHGERMFRAERIEHDVPVDPHALLSYAGSLAKGVGPKTVEKIWADYGAEWRANIDNLAPSVSIPLGRVVDALMANRDRLALTMFCIQNGMGASVADKAWKSFGSNAVATIKANPYALTSIDGIGFKTADEFARKFGIGETDIRRAVAAVDYSVREIMEQGGNSVVDRDVLYKSFDEYRIPRGVASVAVAKLVASKRLSYVSMSDITTSSVIEHEGDLVRYATDCTRESGMSADMSAFALPPDESQLAAVSGAVGRLGVTVVNGGAGVGKTQTITAIAKTLENAGEKVLLCAFAGKAAARIREATGHDASTIHSMLGWSGDGRGFSCGGLYGDNVIVDEASMIPSSLLYELTKRNPRRLVLVGDQAQLQPVGIGSPFHDLIDTVPSIVHTLTKCYRNKEAVFANAMRIRQGLLPEESETRSEKFAVIEVSGPKEAHERIEGIVSSNMVDFQQDAVLAPRNGDGEEPAPCTVKSLNASIQDIVNQHANGETFKVGDRVMCTKNCPDLDMWNGTTGTVTRIDTDGNPYVLKDGGNEVAVRSQDVRKSLVPAYCLTVHKSQGSQYRDVYVVCLKRDGAVLMDRSMLYTAVTRARRACYIITDGCVDRVVNTTHRRRTFFQSIAKEM